jgi:hypothetical protein
MSNIPVSRDKISRYFDRFIGQRLWYNTEIVKRISLDMVSLKVITSGRKTYLFVIPHLEDTTM